MFRRKSKKSALQLLKQHDQVLAEESLKRIKDLRLTAKRLKDGWEERVRDDVSFVIDIGKGREALQQTISNMNKPSHQNEENSDKTHYQISSLQLMECCEYLTSDPGRNERLHLVTGTITADGTRVLSRMEKVKYQSQSPAYVKGDEVDTHQKIIALDENHGHLLLAMFHSHMGRGAGATSPSVTDISFLKRMEKTGIDCLGGIFSMDGYIRFFKEKNEFEMDVYGKGIDKIRDDRNHKIFQIIEGGHFEDKSMENKIQ